MARVVGLSGLPNGRVGARPGSRSGLPAWSDGLQFMEAPRRPRPAHRGCNVEPWSLRPAARQILCLVGSSARRFLARLERCEHAPAHHSSVVTSAVHGSLGAEWLGRPPPRRWAVCRLPGCGVAGWASRCAACCWAAAALEAAADGLGAPAPDRRLRCARSIHR